VPAKILPGNAGEPYSLAKLERKEIPEERRAISIWRKLREEKSASPGEEGAEEKTPPRPAPTAKKAEEKTPSRPAPNKKKVAEFPASLGGGAPEPAGKEPPKDEAAPPEKKPPRPGFEPMAKAGGRPKSVFSRFVSARKPSADGSHAVIVEEDPLADEAPAKSEAQLREELLAQAQAEAADIRARAQAEGSEQGYSQGLAKAREEVRAELMPVLEKFAREVQALLSQRAEILRSAEREIFELALLMGKKILHSELHLRPDAVASVVRHALERAVGWGRVKVQVNPEDCALLEEVRGSLDEAAEGVSLAEIVPNPAISRGGCILESNFGEVDARLEMQVAEVDQALRAALEERLERMTAPSRGEEGPAPPQETPPPPRAEEPRAQEQPPAQSYRPKELGSSRPEEADA